MSIESTGDLARAQVQAIKRPSKALLVSYAIHSLAGLFLAPVIFVPLFFKYQTLKYKIDDEGISASWGILFRREIFLTYKRIQDIHVNRNIIERWLGIAKVELQTASGSSTAELSLEGIVEFELVRDYLYGRMRGHGSSGAGPAGINPAVGGAAPDAEALAVLREIRLELEATRKALEARRDAGGESS